MHNPAALANMGATTTIRCIHPVQRTSVRTRKGLYCAHDLACVPAASLIESEPNTASTPVAAACAASPVVEQAPGLLQQAGELRGAVQP